MSEENREKRRAARKEKRADKEQVRAVDKRVNAAIKGKKKAEKATAKANKATNKSMSNIKSILAGSSRERDGYGSSAYKKAQDLERGITDPENPPSHITHISSKDGGNVVEPKDTVVPTVDGGDVKTETTSNIIQKTNSFDEAASASELGDVVKNTTEEVSNEVDETGNALKENLESVSVATDGGTRTTDEGYQDASSRLSEIARSGDGEYDLSGMSDYDFYNAAAEYSQDLAERKEKAPMAAIEALGIQHYYPPQQDYVTSAFSGRYIGSRQLVSAPDALYPQGLVDARRRAAVDHS